MIQETEMGLTGAQPDAKYRNENKKTKKNNQNNDQRKSHQLQLYIAEMHENILGAVTLDSISIRSLFLFFGFSNLNICHCATHMKCFLELIIFGLLIHFCWFFVYCHCFGLSLLRSRLLPPFHSVAFS